MGLRGARCHPVPRHPEPPSSRAERGTLPGNGSARTTPPHSPRRHGEQHGDSQTKSVVSSVRPPCSPCLRGELLVRPEPFPGKVPRSARDDEGAFREDEGPCLYTP